MASRTVIREQLDLLNIALGSRKSEFDLDVLEEVWTEDLADLTDGQVVDAIRLGRRQWKFFPVSAEVISMANLESAQPQPIEREDRMIPQRTTGDAAENRARAKKMIRKILDRVGVQG